MSVITTALEVESVAPHHRVRALAPAVDHGRLLTVYSVAWNELPEVEGLPNNFRTAVAGREMGVNKIRWIHPTELPPHTHDDAEQAIIVTAGRIAFTIDDEDMILAAGDVAIVPRSSVHGGHSIEGEAEFIEVFAPLRIENLVGFLGGPSMPTQKDAR